MRGLALSIVIPLLLLQTFQASNLFCKGLAHASLLSAHCPHHRVPGRDPAGADGEPTHDAGHAGSSRVPIDETGPPAPCTCPSSGNSLPDGLILTALSGLGLPVIGVIDLPLASDVVIPIRVTPNRKPALRASRLERPPRLLS